MPMVTLAKYHDLEILSDFISLMGVSVLSFCLSRRVPRRWRQWKHLTWGRTCVLLVLLDSWLFVFFSGLLSSGIGLSWSNTTCALAIYTCISFYALSKVLIYAFLSEKVYIVWTGGNQISRKKSKVYRLCAFFLLGYIVVGALMISGRDERIRDDGVCVIGLKSYATISLVVYDISLNIFLTTMFLGPLWVSHPMSPRLRSVAKRTLYGATTSLISSAVNIIIMVFLGGKELGLICLSSCVTDVMVNSLALFWVSSSSYSSSSEVIRDRFSLPTMDMSALTFVNADSRSPPTTEPPSAMPLSPPETLQAIPEDYYDYLPPDHRKDMSNQAKRRMDTPAPLPLEQRPYSKVSDAEPTSTPNSPNAPSFSSASSDHPVDKVIGTKLYTSVIIEEKDISDLV